MKKRDFFAAAATAAALPLATSAQAKPAPHGPVLLTVGGLVGHSNRPALDPVLEQMMAKHGVKFSKAFAFDAQQLRALPAVTLQPTLEYDAKPHQLSGPLLSTVLAAAGVDLKAELRLGLRAVDGYNVNITVAQVQAYRMIVATHLDGQPMALGGLGPQWAVYEPMQIPEFKDKPLKERFGLCPWGLYYIDVAAVG
jgi:hypothetical protein